MGLPEAKVILRSLLSLVSVFLLSIFLVVVGSLYLAGEVVRHFDCWTETDPTIVVPEVVYPQPPPTMPYSAKVGNELPPLCRFSGIDENAVLWSAVELSLVYSFLWAVWKVILYINGGGAKEVVQLYAASKPIKSTELITLKELMKIGVYP